MQATRDILVQTERPDEARAFYEGVLGLRMFLDDPGIRGFDAGAIKLYVETAPSQGGPVLEFLTEDVQAAKAKLVEAGCTVVDENPAIPRCHMRDPFGLLFNVGLR